MTVKELKKMLEGYDEGLHVFLRGYEDGFDDAAKIFLIRIKRDVNKEWYLGRHENNNEDYDCEGIVIDADSKK